MFFPTSNLFHRRVLRIFLGALCLFSGDLAVQAADAPAVTDVQLTLQNHRFTPADVTVPPGVPIKFTVTNMDSTPAEFESDDFKGEKTLPTGQAVTINVAPLKAGTYEFHDEFNEDISKTHLTVK